MVMIPPIESAIWSKLVKGDKPVSTTKLAINLMIQNTKLKYKDDPSPENVVRLTRHMHQFFKQYETVFATEFQKILG